MVEAALLALYPGVFLRSSQIVIAANGQLVRPHEMFGGFADAEIQLTVVGRGLRHPLLEIGCLSNHRRPQSPPGHMKHCAWRRRMEMRMRGYHCALNQDTFELHYGSRTTEAATGPHVCKQADSACLRSCHPQTIQLSPGSSSGDPRPQEWRDLECYVAGNHRRGAGALGSRLRPDGREISALLKEARSTCVAD